MAIETLLLGRNPSKRLQSTLEERGQHVVMCSSGSDAWQAYLEGSFSLVILADVDGEALHFCSRLKHSPHGEFVTVIAVLPEYSQEKLEAVVDYVDECIIESLDRPDRLHARLTFAEKNARGKWYRYLADQELKARLRQRASLAALGQLALRETNTDTFLGALVQTTADALDVEFVTIHLRDSETDRLTVRAGLGWEKPSEDSCEEITEDSYLAYVLREREPLLIRNLAEEKRFRVPDLLVSHAVKNGIVVAVDGEPEPLGIIAVYSSQVHTFSEDDVYFVQSVSNILSTFLERARTQALLRESGARNRAILDTTVDGIITIDTRGIIESFNRAAERLFKYEASEVKGHNISILMPEPYAREHDGYLDSYLRTGIRKIIGIGREVVGRRKDGSTFPMYLAVSEVFVNERRIFTGIVRDLTESRRLEQEVLRVSELERRRIGQDLHDGLGQMLTGIGLICRNLTRRLKSEKHALGEDMQEVTELVSEADQFAKNLARGLIPVEVEADGLSSALRRLTTNAERLFGVRCVFEESESIQARDDTTAIHLYRIAQEALSNAAKHGKASRITVSLDSEERHLRLRVKDDGIGMNIDESRHGGMGIGIMLYRSRLIGGTFDISPVADGGTAVTVTVPFG